MARSLLNITDLTRDELLEVLALSELPTHSLGMPLKGKGAALVFEKPSNRTRHSMEMAVVQLGGHPVYTRGEEIGFDTREPVEDVAAIMSGYHALLCARVFKHSVVERLAKSATVPVINMLSDQSHPLQGLADVLTMRQELGELKGRTVSWVGDWNNVAKSLAEASAFLGMRVRIAAPKGYQATPAELDRIGALGAADIVQVESPFEGVAGADVVHTDVWTSMGQEAENAKRLKAFAGYTVTEEMMSHASSGALFMHCLPAHRGEEVSAEVVDGSRSRVVKQGHNRMHSARGAIAFLMGVKP